MRNKEKKLNAWLQAIHWNQTHPIGTPIVFDSPWHGPHLCFTRSESRVLLDAPYVWVTGHMGAVILDRLQLASESRIDSLQLVSECVGGPLLVPLTTHSPTHPPGLSMSEVIRMAPAKLPSRVDENCRADLQQTKRETSAEQTSQYLESYQKEWIFGKVCIKVSVTPVMYSSNAQQIPKQHRWIHTIPPEMRHKLAVKAQRARWVEHRQKIEATGISFEEHQRELNRLRVQAWRERQANAKKPSKARKKAA